MITSSSHQTITTPPTNNLPIVIVLPNHQTLSVNPVPSDIAKLISELESMMHGLGLKRELPSVLPDSLSLMASYDTTNLAAEPATVYHSAHGHQHDHLHEKVRGRDMNDSDVATTTKDPAALIMGRDVPQPGAAAAAAISDQDAAPAAAMSGSADINSDADDQDDSFDVDAPLMTDDQDSSLQSSDAENPTVAASASQPSGYQPLAMKTNTSSTNATTGKMNKSTVLQQPYSGAKRTLPFQVSSCIMYAFNLWILGYMI
ncbi:hypothetical protein ACLMJK_001171 [Lecanora helva]